jgi:hypothetical protein
MVVRSDGKVLAHESDIGCDDSFEALDYPLLYYIPGSGLLVYVRLGISPGGTEIPGRVEKILNSPSLAISR